MMVDFKIGHASYPMEHREQGCTDKTDGYQVNNVIVSYAAFTWNQAGGRRQMDNTLWHGKTQSDE